MLLGSVDTSNLINIIMEASGDKAPEITVETENIRRNSVPVTDIKMLQPSSEININNACTKIGIVTSKTSVDLSSDAKNESDMKRVDSDSKFGVMETIPLELSSQESAPVSAPPCGSVKPDNLTLQIRSLSLTESSAHSKQEEASYQRPHSATESEAISLSKYFSVNPTENVRVNSEGLEFFNTLADNSEVVSDSVSNDKQNFESTPSVNAKVCRNKPELAQEVCEDSKTNNEESASTQPPLLKFFAEDKSGSDRDGKAFFDKIAEEKSTGNPIILEIKEPVLTATMSGEFLSSPVLSGEIEEAWIPSERTRQALVNMITSTAYSVDKSQLTMPGVIVDEEMIDPVKALLIECSSPQAQQRKVLTANDVTEDEAGLEKLIEVECYHAAVNLTKRLLKSCGQGPGDDGKPSKHTPFSLRLWYTRLALLIKLRKFSLAEVESAAFSDFDRPDLYYEYYPDIYKGKRGTMVPFSLRLLLAELPQYQGNHQVALDNLYRILHIIQKMIKNVENSCAEDGSMIELSESRKNASLDIWCKREKRVLYSILNCVLSQKDYILAVSITKILIAKSQDEVPELYSALGRIYLQLGDVKYAQECFANAASISQGNSRFQVEEQINKALLALTHNNSEDAYKYYQQAYSLNPDNAMLANNMAVCLLYMGRLKESLTLLENTIHGKPSHCVHDGILFNICTLYELESSRCTQKKLGMLELVSKYVGDSFNVSCLKIQSLSKM